MRAALSDRGALLGSGLGVGQCALQSGPRGAQRLRRAFRFNGQPVYVGSQRHVGITGDVPFTIEAWLRFPSAVAHGVLGFGNTSLNFQAAGFFWGFRGAQILSAEYAGNQTAFVSAALPLNRWIFMAYVKTAGVIKTNSTFYANGINQGAIDPSSSSGVPAIASRQMAVGRWADYADYCVADIGGVAVYNRALPAYEIAEHYRGIFSNNDGLVGRWDLDEPDGLIAYDKSGYGNHGTLVGNPQRVQVFRPDRLP